MTSAIKMSADLIFSSMLLAMSGLPHRFFVASSYERLFFLQMSFMQSPMTLRLVFASKSDCHEKKTIGFLSFS